MTNVLKGNFQPEKDVVLDEKDETARQKEEFERAALRRLGGSIAFASPKKGFIWSGDDKHNGNADKK